MKSSDQLYLEKLKFDPKLRQGWLNFFVSNFRVVGLLIFAISLWGIYAFSALPRESNPEVKIPIAVIFSSYPGTSPADMEELVTKKIEKKISGLSGIKKITSNSSNSFSTVTVEFEASEDVDDSIRKLKDQITNVKTELPDDATEPIVKEISMDDQPIITMALSGPLDGFTLRHYADDLRDELEKIPGVREVEISGGDEAEFEIAYDATKLNAYNISADTVNQVIKANNLLIPAGSFEGALYNYPIKADARIFDIKKLAKIPVTHTENGAIVYLSDLAQVREKAITRTSFSRFSIGGNAPLEAITISIIKKTGGSIIDIADATQATVAAQSKNFPAELKYDIITDTASIIKDDFDRLSHDLLITLLLVFGILFLIVGLKEAFVAGLAVPLVFFIAFGVMNLSGITLNFLSLFSLILSLGLLVDDAIVVVSATKQYLRTGKFTPEEAVLLVLNDFKIVLTTTTLTTVWAFLPLLFSTGIMGQYLKSIPITVSVTLLASLLVALMINHPLAAVLERIRLTRSFFYLLIASLITGAVLLILTKTITGGIFAAALLAALYKLIIWYRKDGKPKMRKNEDLMKREWCDDALIKQKLQNITTEKENFFARLMHGIINFNAILPLYEKYLRNILENKKTRRNVLLGTAATFIIAILLPITGIVPGEFFPPSDSEYIFINIKAPAGLRLSETNKLTEKVENILLKYKEIDNFSTIIGRPVSGDRIGGVSRDTSNVASITVNLSDPKNRDITSYEISEQLREDFKALDGAEYTADTPRGGPPSGSAFEARIVGDDLKVLDKIANDLKLTLKKITGVVNADISLTESPADYTFKLDHAKMELYNLNAAKVGAQLRMAIAGSEVSSVIKDGEEIKINATYLESRLKNLDAVKNIQILNLRNQPVYLKDVAKISLEPSVETITRIDQKRAVLLSASVAGTTRPAAVLKDFQDKTADYELPTGYEIIYGGENEQNTESVLSIIRAMVIAGLLIVFTLIIQFNSIKKTVIVLVTIPLALIGVFFGMAIFQVTLSFPGLIGILALFGIVVKNAIILVDKINLNIKSGIVHHEAIIDACKSRLEAIFITSICTILGIMPVTFSNEIWMALGSAVIFGLSLSSFLTLFIVPILYKILVKEKEDCEALRGEKVKIAA